PFESTDDPARSAERTVVVIPSINFDQEALDRHAADIPTLEQRWLYLLFALRRPRVRLVAVTCMPVPDEIVEDYLGLMPGVADARARLHLLSAGDASPRPLAEKDPQPAGPAGPSAGTGVGPPGRVHHAVQRARSRAGPRAGGRCAGLWGRPAIRRVRDQERV